MAILTIQPGQQSVAGSLGNLTFRQHKGKQVLLTKPHQRSGAGRPTPIQRILTSQTAYIWKNAPPADRVSWVKMWESNCLILGQDFRKQFPSPLQMVLHHVVPWLSIIGGSIWPNCRKPGRSPQPGPFFYWHYVPYIGYNFALDPLLTFDYLLIQFSYPFPPSQKNPRRWTRYSRYVAGPVNTARIWDMSPLPPVGYIFRCTAIKYKLQTGFEMLRSTPLTQFVARVN